MKRRIVLLTTVVTLTLLTFNTSYAGWGKEEWFRTIVTVPCSFSSNSELAVGGSYGPAQVSLTGATAHGGSVVYAHYAAREKKCEGWRGRCSGSGTQDITNFTPIQPCPDRQR